jgi:hypothetical protein
MNTTTLEIRPQGDHVVLSIPEATAILNKQQTLQLRESLNKIENGEAEIPHRIRLSDELEIQNFATYVEISFTVYTGNAIQYFQTMLDKKQIPSMLPSLVDIN